MSGTTGQFRLVYLIGEGIFTPVLDSQVLAPLRLLGKHAPRWDCSMLCLTSVRYRGKRGVAAREDEIRAAVPDVAMHFKFRPFLGIPFQDHLWARRLKASLAEWAFGADDRIVVHCRGHQAGSAAAIVKRQDPRVRVLLDMRGDPIDETSGRGLLGRYRRWVSRRMLKRAFAGADGVNTVTDNLAEVLSEGGYFVNRHAHRVIGCCVDTERFFFDSQVRTKQRKALGLEDKFVFCYCGAMSHWQRPDAVAETFAAILTEMADAHLLIISREAERLMGHLAALGVGNEHVTVRSLSHDQVASHLMAADVGLLLREDTATNRVASPVKFAEYLRCGLPVILTPYVGEFGHLVESENIGRTIAFPIRESEAIDAARSIRAQLALEGDDGRRKCSRIAMDRLSWKGRLDELVTLYEQISGTKIVTPMASRQALR